MSDVTGRLAAALSDRYRIERELGAGGMATVYLAADLKHDRKVALKVLKPELAAVIGGMRFLGEIKTTANLQHPHILPLHDSGEVDGTVFYVMPFVDGETLRDRLSRERQLPVADAVRIASEVADALQYAHTHGVIHRDIKPENILLHGGHALVADFGIALAASNTAGTRMTETGMSLGTPHYMSPEQAMGERSIDARSDVYALACVLYEMLVGEPPFTGATAQAIVAKVLGSTPEPPSRLRPTVPAHVEDATLMALSKIPADRFASAAAFAAALAAPAEATTSSRRVGDARPMGRRAQLQRWAWPAAVVVLAAAAIAGWMRSTSRESAQPPTMLSLSLPDFGAPSTSLQRQIEITPDGSTLIYTSTVDGPPRTKRIRLDGSPAELMTNVAEAQADYQMSPDGTEFSAAEFESGALFRYSLKGGSPRPFPRDVKWTQRGAWGHDGSFWVSDYAVSGNAQRRVGPDDRVTAPVHPKAQLGIEQVLPGDRMALVVRQPNGTASGQLALLDLRSGDLRTLVDAAVTTARYTVGYLVYVLGDGSLVAQPFDAGKGTVTGAPVTLARGVTLTGSGIAQFAAAANGTVVFVVDAGRTLAVVDRQGAVRTLLSELASYHHPRYSPDGRTLAVDFTAKDGRDVWLVDVASGGLTRATFERDGHDPSWSDDGKYLVYSTERNGILNVHRVRVGSAAAPESLLASPKLSYSGIWMRGGQSLLTVGQMLADSSGLDIAIVRNGGRGPIEPVVATRFSEQYPALSPDGQWLAYTSNRSGREEVYVRRLQGGDDEIQVSAGGGSEPLWSRDGSELYFRATSTGASGGEFMLMAATIDVRPELHLRARRSLFAMPGYVSSNPHINYDVSPDGRSFVYGRTNPSTRVMVIQNLPALVARLRTAGAP